jgi:hypothetical protein
LLVLLSALSFPFVDLPPWESQQWFIIGALLLAAAARLILGNRGDYFLYRSLLSAWLPLNLFIAAGITTRRVGIAGVIGVAALCAWSIALVVTINTDHSLQRDDWRSVAAAIPASCSTAIAISPKPEAFAVLHYRPDLQRIQRSGSE